MVARVADYKDAVLNFPDTSDESADEDTMIHYERAIKEIARGNAYVCMICTVEMDYTCKMFACNKCYRVFDYDCIREWALKSTNRTANRTWKCPNCLYENKQVPKRDRPTCWCGKVVKPDANPLEPNSCGQTCDAPICDHGCSKVCHLGPHPECSRTIRVYCKCGKHSKDIACSQSNNGKGTYGRFSCGERCGLWLPCGIHRCSRRCHSGMCGPCNEELQASSTMSAIIRCYCGLHERESIKCCDVRVATKDSMNNQGDDWVGVFKCKDVRHIQYSCGHHSFVESCEPEPSLPYQIQCPFSPQILKSCPCGKTPLIQFNELRSRCTDRVPTCDLRCGKKLKCGKHICPYKCHEGNCMDPCLQCDKVPCQCGSRNFLVPCKFHLKPRCTTKCESLMSCRRHRCMERCCSGKVSSNRRRKKPCTSQELLDESLVESEHICLKNCNLTLSCGIHKCQRKCHPGKCPPCLESDPNDLICPCGKTIVEAPVRCGTKLPPCPHECISVTRDGYSCGHKPMPHLCHPRNEPCPPCTASVKKPCKCGKNDVRTLCFQQDVSCGQVCNRPLSTCHHTCQKKCHSGNCQAKCIQICGKKRRNCNHKCSRICHGSKYCPDLPCNFPVVITCDCGRRKSTEYCGSDSKTLSVSETRHLPCDEHCERAKKCMQLKNTLSLIPDTESNTFGISNFEELGLPFTEMALSAYSQRQKYYDGIESIVNSFIDDKKKLVLHFKPMRHVQRRFVHELAKAYNLYSESQDHEPKRSVYIKKEPDGKSCKPPISLRDALSIYQIFKQCVKLHHNEMRSVINLVNFTPKSQPTVELAARNGFLIHNLTDGTSELDLQRIYEEHLKSTLIKNPIYKLLPDRKAALIFPESYSDITVNAERDMERLVGHFDFICKEMFIGQGVELCQVDEYIQLEITTKSK